ncbi:NRAMP family divalent metal transporter [Geoalkalibacter subterraneus]|uniref:NRAMP family divalent metal transporter n=1 Tax=Geoalkalibacter subterraneus TaxID=483547 RepID=UPI000694F0A3|nr:divalent metal cation transporter [Geoalkalibacter subterraneus]
MKNHESNSSSPSLPCSSRQTSRADLWKAIGPGILVACAAVGGSHLVWSTRAGAEFGWSLIGLILLANLLKFPFFLYGQRYAAATGESLLAGYQRQGVIYLYIFLLVNILTGIINIAGVAMLSGALFAGYGIGGIGIAGLTVIILLVCMALILLGHYRLLDSVAKVVVILLALTTFVAVALAFFQGSPAPADFVPPSPWTWGSFAFLIILLGWMPAPVDLSTWSSLWMFSRERQTGHFATSRETSIDFYLGYIMAVVLAVMFLALGKLVMFGTGESFSDSGIVFSQQLVSLYSGHIGEWSKPLILTAAFVTMFSTTMTCVDGYPRSLAACCALIGGFSVQKFQLIHRIWIAVSVAGACALVLFYVKNLIQLLAFAAVISFITSPILAYINYKVMNGANVPEEERPGAILKILSWAGIIFFVLMTAGFVYVKVFY